MNADFVREKLVEVLQLIQATSGLDCPKLEGTTKPTEALAEFDSKIWPVAIGILASKLDISIADDVNIFAKEKSCIALTIDETVAVVMKLAEEQSGETAKQVKLK